MTSPLWPIIIISRNILVVAVGHVFCLWVTSENQSSWPWWKLGRASLDTNCAADMSFLRRLCTRDAGIAVESEWNKLGHTSKELMSVWCKIPPRTSLSFVESVELSFVEVSFNRNFLTFLWNGMPLISFPSYLAWNAAKFVVVFTTV